jgi:hypothetical protein
MVNADRRSPRHSCGLARNAYRVRREISHTPCEPATEGAVTVGNPLDPWQLYPNIAAGKLP